jgi:serine O-acetyltransferase
MSTLISSEVPDWSREELTPGEWAPGKRLLAALRAYQRHTTQPKPWSMLARRWFVLKHRFWSAVSGADIPLNCNIGGGLLMPHPQGIVIHPDARIGVNCLIMQQVTLGATDGTGAPVVMGHVDIGAGAKVLGNITLGEHALVGANAVVLTDVPPGRIAVGVPARLLDGQSND